MKFLKVIILVQLLMPMVGFGQNPNLKGVIPTSILDKRLDSVSRKLFNVVFDTNDLYQNPKLNKVADVEYYSQLLLNDTFQIQIQDNSFPCVEFALKDTVIVKPFLLKDLKSFAISMDQDKIISLAPLRYHHGSNLKSPLFWIKLKDAKKVISDNDIKLITLLSASTKHPFLKYIKKDEFYFDSTYVDIEAQIINGVKTLSLKNFDSSEPRLFKDSLFQEPLYENVFDDEKIETLRQYTESDSIELNFVEFQLAINSNYVLFELTKSYTPIDEDGYGEMIDIFITQNIYLKQEFFFPLLPDWLQFLMKEVYVE